MAYTAISNAEIDTDSPITESLMTRMRDNPLGLASGATGAPRIQNAALATGAVTMDDKIAVSAATGTWSGGAAATQVIPKGIYNFQWVAAASVGSLEYSIDAGSTWGGAVSLTTNGIYQVVSDGVNVRLNAGGGVLDADYKKLF